MDEKEYLSSLKIEVRHYRQTCLERLRQVYGLKIDQRVLREASWAYTRVYGHVLKEHLDLSWPMPIASTYTDIYHQTHFIKATLASIYLPKEPLTSEEVSSPPLCERANTEAQRLENQVLIYQALAALVPAQDLGDKSTPISLPKEKGWKNELLTLTKSIHTMVEELHANRTQHKDEDLHPGGGQGSESPTLGTGEDKKPPRGRKKTVR